MAVLVGVRSHRPRHPGAWWLFGAAELLFAAAVGGWFAYRASGLPIPYPGWPDILFAPAYLCLALGLAVMVRRRSPAHEVQAVLDALILAVGLGFANWVFLIGPALAHGHHGSSDRVAAIGYPLISVAIVALVVRLLFIGGRHWPAGLWMVAAAGTSLVTGNAVFSWITLYATYRGGGVPDLLWMLSSVLLGTAALHPSMAAMTVRVESSREGASRARLMMFMVAIQVPVLVVGGKFLQGQTIPGSTQTFMAMSLGTLVGLRVTHLAAMLLRLSTEDSLTGLVSRSRLVERLERTCRTALRFPGRAALLFVDLDHFKQVNDTLGHVAGDEVLVAMGDRLLAVSRGRDTVARLGGDEFVVLFETLHDPQEAEPLADRVVEKLSAPFLVAEREVFLGASAGLVVLRGQSAAIALREADTAMYAAKAAGRGRWVAFRSSMGEQVTDLVDLDTDVRHALARGELRLVYQPVVSLRDGAIRGFEALLRWRHPTRGEVSPTLTIPALERTGTIHEVGAWILTEALETLAVWRLAHQGLRTRLAVNVAKDQLIVDGFAHLVAEQLRRTGTEAADVCLEITETSLVRDDKALARTLRELVDSGLVLALDDFGTGYSTLAQLAQLPVHIIKVDRSFVAALGDPDGRHETLIHALLDMAGMLKITVIAEGVERLEQADRLRVLGCPEGQGFWFSRPLETDEMLALDASTLLGTGH